MNRLIKIRILTIFILFLRICCISPYLSILFQKWYLFQYQGIRNYNQDDVLNIYKYLSIYSVLKIHNLPSLLHLQLLYN